MFQTRKFYTLFFIIGLAACSNVEKLDTSKVKTEMESFKIKRITPTQINEQVDKMGKSFAEALSTDFEQQMKTASSARKEELCQLKNIKLIDSLSSTYNLTIRLLGQPDVGSNVSLFAKEKEVLEAYTVALRGNQPLADNIQKIGDSVFVYTSPMNLKNGVAKMCYSDDSGFAIWSIVMRKPNVIRLINTK